MQPAATTPVKINGTPTNAAKLIHCLLGLPIPSFDVFFSARSNNGYNNFCIVGFFSYFLFLLRVDIPMYLNMYTNVNLN